MKKKCLLKILPVLLIAAIAVFILSGCTMEFDNYDDDAYIIKSTSSSRYMSSQITTNDGIKWNVKSFGGVSSLKTNLELDTNAVLNIHLEYESGQFKIVAIKDDTVFKLIENESCAQLETALEKGTYTIKAVGNDACFQMTYRL